MLGTILGFIAGFGIAAFVFKNNEPEANKIVDTIEADADKVKDAAKKL